MPPILQGLGRQCDSLPGLDIATALVDIPRDRFDAPGPGALSFFDVIADPLRLCLPGGALKARLHPPKNETQQPLTLFNELSPIVGDAGFGSGGGVGLRNGFGLKSVFEAHSGDDLGQLVRPIEAAPGFLRLIDELELHDKRGRIRQATF